MADHSAALSSLLSSLNRLADSSSRVLALASLLSDLVSHKTSIDSLFLDEGFGTLDSETLDIALDALDNLNATGKMIGVISHVEAMKERIPTQLVVTKKSGLGTSELDKQFRVNGH